MDCGKCLPHESGPWGPGLRTCFTGSGSFNLRNLCLITWMSLICLINYIKFSYTALLNSFGSRLKSLTLKTTELNPVIHIFLQQDGERRSWRATVLKKIPTCIPKTLISLFRCVWLRLVLNSAGTPGSTFPIPDLQKTFQENSAK